MNSLDYLKLQIDSLHGLNAIALDRVCKIKLCLHNGPKVFLPRHANYVAQLLPGDVLYSTDSKEESVWTSGGLVLLNDGVLRVVTTVSSSALADLTAEHKILVNHDLQKLYQGSNDTYVQSWIARLYQKINNQSINKE